VATALHVTIVISDVVVNSKVTLRLRIRHCPRWRYKVDTRIRGSIHTNEGWCIFFSAFPANFATQNYQMKKNPDGVQ